MSAAAVLRPTSSISVSAASPAMSHAPQRRSVRPPTWPRPPSRSTSAGCTRPPASAGSSPATDPMTASTPNAMSNAVGFGLDAQIGRQRDRRELKEGVEHERRGQRTERAAGGDEQQRLHQELPHQLAAARAKRRAHRELAAAGDDARDHQAGHVRRGDGQQQYRRAEQQPGAAAKAAAPVLTHRLHAEPHAALVLRIVTRETAAECRDFVLRGARRRTRPQASDRPRGSAQICPAERWPARTEAAASRTRPRRPRSSRRTRPAPLRRWYRPRASF